DPLSIEQMFQHATGHHTDRSLFHKRFEDFPQRDRHPCPSFIGSLLLARGTKLPKNSSTLEGLTLIAKCKPASPLSFASAHACAPRIRCWCSYGVKVANSPPKCGVARRMVGWCGKRLPCRP